MSDIFEGFSVELIGETIPLKAGLETAEDLMVYCARVSNPANQMNVETGAKLLNYCIRNKHWSVFEQVDLTFEFHLARDIGRQVLRHSFKFQERSFRYSEVEEEGFVVRELRKQDPKNRQASIDFDDPAIQKEWAERQKHIWDYALTHGYHWALAQGGAKECARVVLPEGNTPSTMNVKGSLRLFINWIDVRTEMGTQKEHRFLANEVKKVLIDRYAFAKEYWA